MNKPTENPSNQPRLPDATAIQDVNAAQSNQAEPPDGFETSNGQQKTTLSPIEFTRFKDTNGARLTKAFELDADRKIKKISQTQLCRGIANRVEIESLDELPAVLDRLDRNQCISTGVFDLPLCEVVLASNLTEESIAQGCRSRTKQFLKPPEHALVLLDHDTNEDTPDHVRCISPAELMAKLTRSMPEFGSIAYVGAGSSSAGVYNTETGERYPGSGIHVYISTVCHNQVELAKTIDVRSWNAGYGYIALAANGAMLPRSLVDRSVFAPEGLVYAALPILGEGVSRDPRDWSRREGTALLYLKLLTPEEIAECERRVAEAKRDPELVRKSAELREAHYAKSIERLAQTAGITPDEARARRPRPSEGDTTSDVQYLDADFVLEINGERMTVEQLVARAEEFDGCALPDPYEGSAYGGSTAKFYFDKRNGSSIHSFAHGRSITYVLMEFSKCEHTVILPTVDAGPASMETSLEHNVDTGPTSLDIPLDPAAFPHQGRYNPKATIQNIEIMLHAYRIRVRYDVIARRTEITIPGHCGTADNIDSSTFTQILSLANLNNISTGSLLQFVDAIADKHPVNPVADWIKSKPWDGVDRLPVFYATLTTSEEFPATLKEILLYRWLLSAVAAALMASGFHSRGVLVLCGPQAIGKGSWIVALINDELLRALYIKVDHHLDPSNKDSILGALSHWIVELAELEGTFKRKDIARLKGFITSDKDKVRRVYALRESEYQRRTVFAASVNQQDYLVDDTGNTRWWTLPVVEVNYEHGIDMQQLWAQMACRYESGSEQWWLAKDEERELEQFNQAHRSVSVIRDDILETFDFDAPKDKWHRQTATQVLILLGYHQPNNQLARECGGILRDMFGESTRSQSMTRWLVPPVKTTETDLRLRGSR